jgi:SlyX protein
MSKELEERVDTLEAHIAHQDQMMSDLNEIITGHQKNLDAINAQFGLFMDRVEAMEAANPVPVKPPPHW